MDSRKFVLWHCLHMELSVSDYVKIIRGDRATRSAKFIPRKQWVVAGADDIYHKDMKNQACHVLSEPTYLVSLQKTPLSQHCLRCKSCNQEMTTEDAEDWMYNQLEDTTHLLHGVVHSNGYGHLLRVNGREGGSRVLSDVILWTFGTACVKYLQSERSV
ncbi:hypothetical protein POM88_008415 [Heracleum sosnowskyi]|uniref:Uncharacterized protein n=1 Tax=Heracleum sosnowskyi TaxID=360622 RepID=A0AAD8N790_9APIA|nr:hypothetical protein POM88_008415 [Heracleum sosnowskyi]